jgi:hypothetical protein
MNMQQTRRGQCRRLLALSILLCGLIEPTMAQVIVYDDFSEALIDPARWSPNVISAGNLYEMVRQISGGELFEFLLVNGGNRADIGAAFGRHELRFVRTDFTAMFFDATVLTYALVGCPTPGSQTSAVFVDAPFTLFNDGTTTAQNDQTGDIAARLEIFRSTDSVDPPEMLQTQGAADALRGPHLRDPGVHRGGAARPSSLGATQYVCVLLGCVQ